MAALIDNRNLIFQKALIDSLADAERIDIAVGYFYLSGFAALADSLKDKNVRIVVGKEIDPELVVEMVNHAKNNEEDDLGKWGPKVATMSAVALKENYISTLSTLANDSELLETPEGDKAFNIFMDKIANGTLEVRKTLKDYHGKFYLVYKKQPGPDQSPGEVFMGSNNLTYQGLVGQFELSDSSTDPKSFVEYEKQFQFYWDDSCSINIVNKHNADEFIEKVKSGISRYQLPTPHEIYARVLHELFDRKDQRKVKPPSKITGGRFMDLAYQMDAVRDGIDKMRRYDGVLVADVVGLGKSIVAACIAREMDLKTIIISPPHLMSQWEDYKGDFNLRGPSVFSSGNIEKVFKRYQTSHEPLLVILDEAHRYRNEDTNDYKLLHQICRSHRDNKTLLLTATPFNNTPQDIFALIRLFQTPGQATIRSVDNLSLRFREVIDRHKKLLSQIRRSDLDEVDIDEEMTDIAQTTKRLIESVVIRRSRLDLKEEPYKTDLINQGVDFPDVVGPELIEYDLGPLLNPYLDTLAKIGDGELGSKLTCARYKPVVYIDDVPGFLDQVRQKFSKSELDFIETKLRTTQTNLADFMRRLLVRRFESSKSAFRSTLEKMINGNREIERRWEEDGRVLILSGRKLTESEDMASYEPEDGEEAEDADKLFSSPDGIAVSKDLIGDRFISDVKKDIAILQSIFDKWFGDPSIVDLDPKTDDLECRLKDLLVDQAKRKIIVFSSYADTVDYLYDALGKRGMSRLVRYTSTSANASSRNKIRANFDASLPASEQQDKYDVLLATDAVSEGYNLHRADIVINYDIPYNPTRVIQRIGRINRIGAKTFDKIYIFNSFPTAVGENETRIKQIATMKIRLFNDIIGNDTKILTGDEKPQRLLSEFVDNARDDSEQKSWDAIHRANYSKISSDVELMGRACKIPRRARILRKGRGETGVIVFGKKGDQSIFTIAAGDSPPRVIGMEGAIDYFVAEPDEKPYEVVDRFSPVFKLAREELFARHPLPTIRGRRQEVLSILNAMRKELPAEDGYYVDLIKVIKDFDDVSEGSLREIMRIDLSDIATAHAELEGIVSGQFVRNVIDKVQRTEEGLELVLLSEEMEA